jgi:hypothetical protein
MKNFIKNVNFVGMTFNEVLATLKNNGIEIITAVPTNIDADGWETLGYIITEDSSSFNSYTFDFDENNIVWDVELNYTNDGSEMNEDD